MKKHIAIIIAFLITGILNAQYFSSKPELTKDNSPHIIKPAFSASSITKTQNQPASNLISGQNASFENQDENGFIYKAFAGASIPLGEFASSDLAYGAFASAGWTIGIDVSKHFYKGINLNLTAAFSSNNLDADRLQDTWRSIPDYYYIIVKDAGSHKSLWILAGPGGQLSLNENTYIYGSAKIGYFTSSYAEYSLNAGNFYSKEVTASTIGYNITAGINYSGIDLSFKFMYARPKYNINAHYYFYQIGGEFKQNVCLLLICLGCYI